jgi:hypothetical protein
VRPQRDKIAFGKDDFAIQHTHPNASSDKPSANDVEAAKKIKKPIYVTSRTGLWMASSDGKVTAGIQIPDVVLGQRPEVTELTELTVAIFRQLPRYHSCGLESYGKP